MLKKIGQNFAAYANYLPNLPQFLSIHAAFWLLGIYLPSSSTSDKPFCEFSVDSMTGQFKLK